MEFAVPKIAEFVSGRKRFKRAAKSVGRQTLRNHLDGGGRQRRVIPTKSTEQTIRSYRDVFAENSR